MQSESKRSRGSRYGFFPMLLVMGTIFFLSHQPGDSFVLPDIFSSDKVLHAIAFGTLALTVLFAVPQQRYEQSFFLISLFVVLFCIAYGISDEFHQVFVRGRCPSGADVAADGFGALLAVTGWYMAKRYLGRGRLRDQPLTDSDR